MLTLSVVTDNLKPGPNKWIETDSYQDYSFVRSLWPEIKDKRWWRKEEVQKVYYSPFGAYEFFESRKLNPFCEDPWNDEKWIIEEGVKINPNYVPHVDIKRIATNISVPHFKHYTQGSDEWKERANSHLFFLAVKRLKDLQ